MRVFILLVICFIGFLTRDREGTSKMLSAFSFSPKDALAEKQAHVARVTNQLKAEEAFLADFRKSVAAASVPRRGCGGRMVQPIICQSTYTQMAEIQGRVQELKLELQKARLEESKARVAAR